MFSIEMFGLLLGGLALFLFGLELLTGAFKVIAGTRLQSLLSTLSSSRIRGLLVGAGITALVNSSTITTVLLLGFVSSGLMSLAQVIPMILGANIGSTVTVQLVASSNSSAMYFLLGGGFMLRMLAKHEKWRQSGNVLMGLGLLFLGIQLMSEATTPLRTYEPFINAMQDMRSPLMGILIGAVFTAIVQSSAATLAVVIALSVQGLVPLETGIALVLGANLGTSGTTLIAAIGKPPQAMQVALVHLMFNLFGVLVFVLIIPWLAEFVRWISPVAPELEGVARMAAETPRQIANAHTIFNVTSALLLIGFTSKLERLAQWLAPNKAQEWRPSSEPRFLDPTLMSMPALAVGRVQLELDALGQQVLGLVRRGVQVAVNGSERDISALIEDDKCADHLGAEILTYLGNLAESEQSDQEGREIVDLTRIIAGLDALREVSSTSLVAISHRRLVEEIDLVPLHTRDDAVTTQFYMAVLDCMEQAIGLIAKPDAVGVSQVVDAKPDIERMAAAARESIINQLPLHTPAGVMSFRLSNDLIEHFNEMARLSRAIAKATRHLRPVHSRSVRQNKT